MKINLYHCIIISLSPLSLSLNSSIICPAKWKNGGRGLEDFRKFIYKNHDIKSLITFSESTELFPTANIAGGIIIINWSKDWNRPAKLSTYNSIKDKPTSVNRFLDSIELETPIIIDDKFADSIIKKIQKKSNNKYLNQITSVRKPYGFCTDIFGDKNKNNIYWANCKDYNAYKIYGVIGKKGGAKRTEGWIKSDFVNIDVLENKDKYKLFISKAFTFKPPFSSMPKIIIAKPKEICSETFLSIGCFDTEEQAKNCLSYIKTKFWRYLFKIYWSGMNVSKKNFSLIPLVDFNKQWTDKELYEYFNLSKEEVDYIEEIIGEFNNADD